MKKTVLFLLLAFTLTILAGCSGNKTEKTGETTEKAAAETVAETETETSVDLSSLPGTAGTGGTVDPDAINGLVEALEVVEPEVLGTVASLAEYKGITVAGVTHVEITAEDVEDYINDTILPNYTEETEEPIQNGDVANIDYEGKKDGVAFDGGTAQGYDLSIGSGSFIDGFESGLVGHKAGETVDLNLTFPENYNAEELAGQAVVFTVKINSVKRQPELTDEIARNVDSTCTSADALRETIRAYLQNSQDMNEQQELYYNAVTAVLENSEVTSAEDAIAFTVNNYIRNCAEYFPSLYGVDFGTMLSYYGMSFEEFVSEYSEVADSTVAQRVVLREIAKKENLTVTGEDIEAFAEAYGSSVEMLQESLGEKLLEELTLEDKANRFIVDNAVITEAAE